MLFIFAMYLHAIQIKNRNILNALGFCDVHRLELYQQLAFFEKNNEPSSFSNILNKINSSIHLDGKKI